jgi:hypothetical protein
VGPERGEPERVLVPLGPVQVRHEDEPGQHVGRDDVRPRDQRDAGRAAEQERRVKNELLRGDAERHAEEQSRGQA